MQHSHILDHSKALEFMLAGHAIITIKNEETENRFTYMISRKKKVKGVEQNVWWVKLLYNCDNTKDYKFMGTIFKNPNGSFSFGRSANSAIKADAPSFLAFEYTLRHLFAGDLNKIINIYRYNYCARCGELLTVPQSIVDGYGPVCVKLVKKGKSVLF